MTSRVVESEQIFSRQQSCWSLRHLIKCYGSLTQQEVVNICVAPENSSFETQLNARPAATMNSFCQIPSRMRTSE